MQPLGAVASNVHQPGRPEPKLVRAAHEFEGQLMKELLKPLNAGGGWSGEDEDSGSAGALGDFASEALGQALSRQGGFGIADKIIGRLSHSGTVTGSEKVTAHPLRDTGMRPLR